MNANLRDRLLTILRDENDPTFNWLRLDEACRMLRELGFSETEGASSCLSLLTLPADYFERERPFRLECPEDTELALKDIFETYQSITYLLNSSGLNVSPRDFLSIPLRWRDLMGNPIFDSAGFDDHPPLKAIQLTGLDGMRRVTAALNSAETIEFRETEPSLFQHLEDWGFDETEISKLLAADNQTYAEFETCEEDACWPDLSTSNPLNILLIHEVGERLAQYFPDKIDAQSYMSQAQNHFGGNSPIDHIKLHKEQGLRDVFHALWRLQHRQKAVTQ